MSDSIREKAAHVRRATQTRAHTCHWPGCTVQVPPAMWGCRRHWYMLPRRLRSRLWATYRPGQEQGDAKVSSEYLDAAQDIDNWIADHGR